MSVTRRDFLAALGAAGAAECVPGRIFAGAKADYDENLTVFLSDVHVGGLREDPGYQLGYLKAQVAEILKMDPLPKRALVFGDVAYLYGRAADYAASRPTLQLLRDAGLELYVTTGNHDHRAAMAGAWPDLAAKSPVAGKFVSVVKMPTCDFILFDSLHEDLSSKEAYNPVPGELTQDQYDWMAAELPKWPRPFFLGCHHPLHEIAVAGGKASLRELALRLPRLAGYVHGHDHRWVENWGACRWGSRRCLKTLTLPSTGHWGDIGYTLFRTDAATAKASFVQKDFFFSTPLKPGEARPPEWEAIRRGHTGATCAFDLPCGA